MNDTIQLGHTLLKYSTGIAAPSSLFNAMSNLFSLLAIATCVHNCDHLLSLSSSIEILPVLVGQLLLYYVLGMKCVDRCQPSPVSSPNMA